MFVFSVLVSLSSVIFPFKVEGAFAPVIIDLYICRCFGRISYRRTGFDQFAHLGLAVRRWLLAQRLVRLYLWLIFSFFPFPPPFCRGWCYLDLLSVWRVYFSKTLGLMARLIASLQISIFSSSVLYPFNRVSQNLCQPFLLIWMRTSLPFAVRFGTVSPFSSV